MNGIMHIFLIARTRLLVTMTGKKHLTFPILCAILFGLSGRERPGRAWYLGVAQLVARYLGVVEAASSSLVTQTRKREMSNLPFFQFLWDFFEA